MPTVFMNLFILWDSVASIKDSSGFELLIADSFRPFVFTKSGNCTAGQIVEVGKLQEP